MLIKHETLDRIFNGRSGSGRSVCGAVCIDCGVRVRVTVSRTAAGYGLQGGALYEPRPEEILAKCPDCYRTRPRFTDFRDKTAEPDPGRTCHWDVLEGDIRKAPERHRRPGPHRTTAAGLPNLPKTESSDH